MSDSSRIDGTDNNSTKSFNVHRGFNKSIIIDAFCLLERESTLPNNVEILTDIII
jgi:hypothetical protein